MNLLAQARAILATEKSVKGVVDDYRVTLTEFCVQAFGGRMDKVDFQRAHRALLRQSARDVYVEGYGEGLGEGDAEAEMDEEDNARIADFYTEQSGFVPTFAKDVVAARTADDRESAQQAIFDRCATWAQSLEALGGIARAAAQKNQMGEWEYGDTDHCDTCAKLNSQRHRVKWFVERGYIPRQPGNENLDCKGFRCQCRVKNDKGDTIL